MPNPKKLKATGDRNSGYTNTLKINNTSYVSNKDKIYSCFSNIINTTLYIYELNKFLKSDFEKLCKYFPKFKK